MGIGFGYGLRVKLYEAIAWEWVLDKLAVENISSLLILEYSHYNSHMETEALVI